MSLLDRFNDPSKAWYQNELAIASIIVLFWPVGLLLLLKYSSRPWKQKGTIAGLIAVVAVVTMVFQFNYMIQMTGEVRLFDILVTPLRTTWTVFTLSLTAFLAAIGIFLAFTAPVEKSQSLGRRTKSR